MKKYLTISVDVEFGEASLTEGTSTWINDCIKHDPILAADALKDVICELEEFYEKSVLEIMPHLKEQIANET